MFSVVNEARMDCGVHEESHEPKDSPECLAR